MTEQKKQNQKEVAEEIETKEEETISVPKKDLKKLLDRIDSIEKDRDMLIQVADKKSLSNYYSRHGEKIPTRVNLRTMKGTPKTEKEKVIVGWRTTKDEVYQDAATMRWIESQKVELLYDDGQSEEMFLKDFNRQYKQAPAEVKEKTIDEETGNIVLKVARLDNGQVYKIGITFIN